MNNILHSLPSSTLRVLASSLREGILADGITSHGVQQVLGIDQAADVLQILQQFPADGWSSAQIAILAETIATARDQATNPEMILDLVLSGPEVAGIPTRDTAAVMHALVENAQQEVILIGYAVHNGRKLFTHLAERMRQLPKLQVWFCLNIPRKFNDKSLSSEIVRRFAITFVSKHWPWEPRPELYYDPRTLTENAKERPSLHAKCLIIDRREALITSANLTEAAQLRNIEAGVVIKYGPFAERLASYFEGLRESNRLQKCVFSSFTTIMVGYDCGNFS